jgi:hypothetical protein
MSKLKSSWTPEWDFDFSVHLSTHVASTMPGQSVDITVLAELVGGDPQPVILTIANAGLIAQINPSPTVTPPETVTLHVTVPPNTPPGSYMLAVRGETEGTFKTSEDTVTIVVGSSRAPGQGSGENSGGAPTAGIGGGKKASPKPRPARPGQPMRKRPAPPSKRSRYLGMAFGALTLVAVAAVIALNLTHFHLNHGGVSVEHWLGTETFCLMGQDVGLGVVTADDCGSPITDFTLMRYSNGSVQTDGGGGIFGLNGQIGDGGQFSGYYNTTGGTNTVGENFTVTGTFYSNGSAYLYKDPVMPEGGGGVNINWHLYRE